MRLVRVPTVRIALLACVLGWVSACGAGAPDDRPAARPAARVEASPVPRAEAGSSDDLAGALGVLRAWDARRAAAWRARDSKALRVLYVPGSSALSADLALLRAYADRGLVVRRMEVQVFAAQLLQRSPRVLRLRVHDRTRATVRGGARPESVRDSDPAQRVIELRWTGGRWRMASVSGG